MTEVTLATKNSRQNIIGAYWPNRHGIRDSSEQNLWKCLNRYVLQHKRRDSNPTELLQRVAMQWIATAHKNGSRGSILCGDLNATWVNGESGGQSVLHNWAQQFSLQNGPYRVAQQLQCHMYTRGGEGQSKTWIDHVLHKGSPEHIEFLAGYTSQAAEWEGISDHRPIWGIFKVHEPLQSCPKQVRTQKVRYELRLTDKQKCDEFTEAMEAMIQLPTPNDSNTDEEIIEYMRHLETHSGQIVRRLYTKAGQCDKRSTRKDGWSPTYIAYKIHLTTLVEIRRCLMGQAGRKRWRTVAEMMAGLIDILGLWECTLDGLDLTNEQKGTILCCSPRPIRWWKELERLPEVTIIDEDMDRIKGLLHGTARTEMRRRINSNVRYREGLRRDGKWRKVISSVLGN